MSEHLVMPIFYLYTLLDYKLCQMRTIDKWSEGNPVPWAGKPTLPAILNGKFSGYGNKPTIHALANDIMMTFVGFRSAKNSERDHLAKILQ